MPRSLTNDWEQPTLGSAKGVPEGGRLVKRSDLLCLELVARLVAGVDERHTSSTYTRSAIAMDTSAAL